jgi:hypothetical protein
MSQKQKEYFKETEEQLIGAIIPQCMGDSITEIRHNIYNTIQISLHDEEEIDYLISEYLKENKP